MEELLKREDARRFLREEVALHYKSVAELERWAKNYDGDFRDYLSKVIDCFKKKRSFGLSESQIEQILDETIPAKAP